MDEMMKGSRVEYSEDVLRNPRRSRFRGRQGTVSNLCKDWRYIMIRWDGAENAQQMWRWEVVLASNVGCNLPFERVPTCACDKGLGSPPSRQMRLECKLRGGPCA